MVTGRRTIVCIDDDPDVINLFDLMLRSLELEFTGAIDGQQGLETIRNPKPDPVLLDHMLPSI